MSSGVKLWAAEISSRELAMDAVRHDTGAIYYDKVVVTISAIIYDDYVLPKQMTMAPDLLTNPRYTGWQVIGSGNFSITQSTTRTTN